LKVLVRCDAFTPNPRPALAARSGIAVLENGLASEEASAASPWRITSLSIPVYGSLDRICEAPVRAGHEQERSDCAFGGVSSDNRCETSLSGAPQRRRSPVGEGPTQGGCWLNLVATLFDPHVPFFSGREGALRLSPIACRSSAIPAASSIIECMPVHRFRESPTRIWRALSYDPVRSASGTMRSAAAMFWRVGRRRATDAPGVL
jgi:hypothetical protein